MSIVNIFIGNDDGILLINNFFQMSDTIGEIIIMMSWKIYK